MHFTKLKTSHSSGMSRTLNMIVGACQMGSVSFFAAYPETRGNVVANVMISHTVYARMMDELGIRHYDSPETPFKPHGLLRVFSYHVVLPYNLVVSGEKSQFFEIPMTMFFQINDNAMGGFAINYEIVNYESEMLNPLKDNKTAEKSRKLFNKMVLSDTLCLN